MIFPLALVLLFCRIDSFVIFHNGSKRSKICSPLTGFQLTSNNRKFCSTATSYNRVFVVLSSSPDNEITEIVPNSSSTSSSPEITMNQEKETQKRLGTLKSNSMSYPIDLPSPILLGASVILAISSIGSIFELFGGTPQLGMVGTGAIALVGTPLCLYLFYAAVLKGNAETEEDDKKFLGGR